MELTWIGVADTAIKIGLGALITAISGFLMLVRNQSHELDTELRRQFYKLQEEKKIKYVEFLSQSSSLIQSFTFTNCSHDAVEYKLYLRAFNEIQIISNDKIRLAAFNLFSSVSTFILLNKNRQDIEILEDLKSTYHKEISTFQKTAQIEVTKVYTKI